MYKYRFGLLVILCLMLLAFTACGSDAGTGEESGDSESSAEEENGSDNGDNSTTEGSSAEESSSAEEDDFEWPEVISFATPSQGSSNHVAATIIADMLKENTGIRQVVLEPYGNAGAMVHPLSDGDVDFALHGGYRNFTDAYYGEFAYEEDGPLNVNNLMYFALDPWGVLVTDPEIENFGDLEGKTLALLSNNRDHVNVFNAYLDLYDMTEEDITVLPVTSVGNAYEWLRDGRADAFPFGMAPALQEVKQTRGLWGLPVPEDEMEFITEAEPTRLPYTIEAGTTVLAPEEDLPVFGLPLGIAVNPDVDEELVYRIVKLIYEESADDLFEAKPDHERNWKPEAAADVFTFPFHEGMIRYLEEEGIWTEELQEQQEELIR